MKEFEFLKIIENTLSDSSYLGDDCAYLKEFNLALSADSLIEDVHFKLDYMTPFEVAQKALLVNVSDILAMGAEPKYALVSLSGNLDCTFVKDFYLGLNATAEEFKVKIIGGDLTKSDKIMISIAILGTTKNRNISSRSNAKKGYVVAAAGCFGSSASGLNYLLEGKNDNEFTLIHKKPKLHPLVSNEIAKKTKKPYAMMDSSDGLVDCLYQISKKSNVKIEVDYSKIPKQVDDINLVLFGGEDYSLVVCLDENDFKKVKGLTQIGLCKEGKGIFVDNKEISYKAFSHF